jgi:hypothetical protein
MQIITIYMATDFTAYTDFRGKHRFSNANMSRLLIVIQHIKYIKTHPLVICVCVQKSVEPVKSVAIKCPRFKVQRLGFRPLFYMATDFTAYTDFRGKHRFSNANMSGLLIVVPHINL